MKATTSVVPELGMTVDEFRLRGKLIVDRIADYYESIESYRVRPETMPGDLRSRLPTTAPNDPESWDSIVSDFDQLIMPGVTHWQSPHFHAYFPAQVSFPALIGDMLSGMINAIGFSWIGCPAMTELEIVVMDWLSNAIGLPESFRSKSGGGGVIQGTASEAVLVAVLTARDVALLRGVDPAKLTAYLTSHRHASCDKALHLAGILNVRLVNDSDHLKSAIDTDISQGFQPMFVGVTLGYTSTAAYDDLSAIAAVCSKYLALHLHVDAAYAGSALLCPEYRYMIKGVEHASSFNFNPHKWMLTNFDCSAYFVTDQVALQNAMSSDMSIYHNQFRDLDLRNWTIPLGRRFRALKIWFVMRSFGISGLQANIRRQCSQAKRFEKFVLEDERFELFCPCHLGLVCFRFRPIEGQLPQSTNHLNLALIGLLNNDGRIFLVHSAINEVNFIRFCICSALTRDEHVDFAWEQICEAANRILKTTFS